jgi:serine/threonine protein kinase
MLRLMSSAPPPTHIGPYEIVARLGIGGMAETYVATRRGPGAFAQRVCLKRLRPELEGDPEFVRQFLAEAAIVARLRHAAIAQVLDFGQHGPHYYLALELVEGCDLRELLQAAGGALAPPLVLYVAVEVATALDFAHRAGGAHGSAAIVHRDVSPSNTLVSTEGEVKLTDFGIARTLGEAKHTRTGIVKGKVQYMAPEYARSAHLDPRSDLFSLGVLLYECACGVRPHDGATELETLERASRALHTPLGERAPALAPEFVDVVERLLQPDPERRYQTAADALQALLQLPVSPRARLDLGALVGTAVRERARTPGAPPLASVATATELMADPAGDPATRGRPASPSAAPQEDSGLHPSELRRALARPGRGARIALAIAGLCAASVLAVALLRAPRTPEPSAAPDGLRPEATPPVIAPSAPVAGAEPSWDARELDAVVARSTGAPAEPSATAKPALLEVIVVPYGEVTIDGKHAGKAPLEIALTPGEHTVEAHNRGHEFRARVTLVAGQRKRLVLR